MADHDIVGRLMDFLRDALDNKAEQTSSLEKLREALQKISDVTIPVEKWEEVRTLVTQIHLRMNHIHGELRKIQTMEGKIDDLHDWHDKEDEHGRKIWYNYDKDVKDDLRSLSNRIDKAVAVFESTMKQVNADRDRNLDLNKHQQNNRNKIILRILAIIGGALTSGGILYLLVERVLSTP